MSCQLYAVAMSLAAGRMVGCEILPCAFARMMKQLLVIGLILFAWNPQPAEAKDDIRIVSLSPPTDKPLRAGDTVTFEIKVQMEVDPSAGMRRLHVGAYRVREQNDILVAWQEIVLSGKHTLSFKGIARVPATRQISVLATISDPTFRGLGKRALSYDAKDYSVVDAAGKKVNATTSRKDTVTITSVSPAAGSTLKTGETVTFDLKADYDFRSFQTGRVVLGFTSQGNVQPVLASEPIRRGKGKLSFNRSLQMGPAIGGEPVAFVLLLPEDSVRGTAIDQKSFRVEQSAESSPDTPSRITVNVSDEFEDHLRITAITPSLGTPLRTGETIDFEVKIDYDINSVDVAQLDIRFGVFTTYADTRIPAHALDSRILERGRGSLVVTRRLWIPTGLSSDYPVTVRLSMPANGGDTITYKVTP